MRLLCLNIWGGKLPALLPFIKERSKTTDIFCLQEVFWNGTKKTMFAPDVNGNVFADIEKILPEFKGVFTPTQDGEWGLAMFVRKTIPCEDVGEVFVLRNRDAMINDDATTLGQAISHASIEKEGGNLLVGNFHGWWAGVGKGKEDFPERIEQSKNILKFLRVKPGRKILCGDFNISLDTKSMKMIEEEGMVNLIRKHGVTSTRSHHYGYPNKYADYVLVTPDVKVNKFEVLSDVVSDHLPLVVDFE